MHNGLQLNKGWSANNHPLRGVLYWYLQYVQCVEKTGQKTFTQELDKANKRAAAFDNRSIYQPSGYKLFSPTSFSPVCANGTIISFLSSNKQIIAELKSNLKNNLMTFQLIKMHYCHSEGSRQWRDLIEMIKTPQCVSKSLTQSLLI